MSRFGQTRWIVSEDVNVEHLLDLFTCVDPTSRDVWDGCSHFTEHLYWHKPRQTVLRSKIEGLADDHPSKSRCLFELSRLFESVGNHTERKRHLAHNLELGKERGENVQVSLALTQLSDANRQLGLFEEGIGQANEALEIFKRFGDTSSQSQYLFNLALSSLGSNQLAAAEKAASCMINLPQRKVKNFRSVDLIVSLDTYIAPKEGKRKPSIISRQPSASHPRSTGTVN